MEIGDRRLSGAPNLGILEVLRCDVLDLYAYAAVIEVMVLSQAGLVKPRSLLKLSGRVHEFVKYDQHSRAFYHGRLLEITRRVIE